MNWEWFLIGVLISEAIVSRWKIWNLENRIRSVERGW